MAFNPTAADTAAGIFLRQWRAVPDPLVGRVFASLEDMKAATAEVLAGQEIRLVRTAPDIRYCPIGYESNPTALSWNYVGFLCKQEGLFIGGPPATEEYAGRRAAPGFRAFKILCSHCHAQVDDNKATMGETF